MIILLHIHIDFVALLLDINFHAGCIDVTAALRLRWIAATSR